MSLSISLCFKSERFDYRSELPDDFNAGNRFYGCDLAEYMSQQLSAQGVPADFLDEDWGWLVFSPRNSRQNFQIAIYNLSDHREGGRPGVGEWGLWIQAFETRKLLGLIPRQVESAVPAEITAAITAAVNAVGAELEPWDDSPGDGD